MGGHTFIGDETEAEVAQSFIDLIYETKDGFVSVAVMLDKHWKGFAEAVGQEQLMEDSRFNTPAGREENKDERTQLMQEAMRAFTTEDLIDRLESKDVPCAPVLTRTEMRQHPQVIANGIIEENKHPQAGALRQTRQPARFSETANEHRFGAPVYGAHTREILREAGFNPDNISALEESGAVWQGDKDEK